MTRTSRTLLILVLMSIGTVVVLAMMAQRYGKVLDARQQARSTAPASNVSGPLADAEAARNVAAYLDVKSALGQAEEALGNDAPHSETGQADLRMIFDRALVESRLERAGFQEMDAVVRAWEAGSNEVPQAYRRELDRRAAEVRASRSVAYDPLER